jgi:hypothetical protein
MNDLAIFIWPWYVPEHADIVLQGLKDKGFTTVATAQRLMDYDPGTKTWKDLTPFLEAARSIGLKTKVGIWADTKWVDWIPNDLRIVDGNAKAGTIISGHLNIFHPHAIDLLEWFGTKGWSISMRWLPTSAWKLTCITTQRLKRMILT